MKFLALTFLMFFSSLAMAAECNPPSAARLARSQAFLQNTPCAAAVSSCNQGGYVLNCHKLNGKGLEVDCLQPLFHGVAVPGVTIAPNDPNVTGCKTFCHSNKGACAEQKGVSDR